MIRVIGVPSSLNKRQSKVFRAVAREWSEAGISKTEISAVFGTAITESGKRRKRGVTASAVRAEIVRQIKAGETPRPTRTASARGVPHSVYFVAEAQKTDIESAYWNDLFLALFQNKNPLYPPALLRQLHRRGFWSPDFVQKVEGEIEFLWILGVKNGKTRSFFEVFDNIRFNYDGERVNSFLRDRRVVGIKAYLLREVSARARFFAKQEEEAKEAKNGKKSKKAKK